MRRALISNCVSRRVHQRHQGKRALCACDANGDNNKWKTRHSSTPATPGDAAASKLVEEKIWQKHQETFGKKAIFPWRHDKEPLDRLVDPTIQGGVLGPGLLWPMPLWLKHIFTQTAAVHLNVPWYKVFLDSKWSQELADASGFAFSQAVAGVLSNTYKVPFQDIVRDDGVIDFSTVTQESDSDAKEEVVAPSDEQAEEEKNDNDEDNTPQVEYMMEEKLRKLYEASHEFGKDQMSIRLETTPVQCELVSLLFIPYLTRQAVHDSPSLRHSYSNMFRALEKKRVGAETGQPMNMVQLIQEAFGIFEEFVRSRAQPGDDSIIMESTVIAQVLVTCDEVFSVTDVATGMIMQGNGEMQRVYHLVRLEVVVKETIPRSGGKPTFQVESWQIVDWDDLEGGNIWFV